MNLYQLEFNNGRVFDKIFKTSSKTNIKDYVLLNFHEFSNDLDLSESYSCSINISHDKNTIIISGDEDYHEIKIKEVQLTEL